MLRSFIMLLLISSVSSRGQLLRSCSNSAVASLWLDRSSMCRLRRCDRFETEDTKLLERSRVYKCGLATSEGTCVILLCCSFKMRSSDMNEIWLGSTNSRTLLDSSKHLTPLNLERPCKEFKPIILRLRLEFMLRT